MNTLQLNNAFDNLVKAIRKIFMLQHLDKITMTNSHPDEGYTFFINSKYLEYKGQLNKNEWNIYCNFDFRTVTLNNQATGFETLVEFSRRLPQIYTDIQAKNEGKKS